MGSLHIERTRLIGTFDLRKTYDSVDIYTNLLYLWSKQYCFTDHDYWYLFHHIRFLFINFRNQNFQYFFVHREISEMRVNIVIKVCSPTCIILLIKLLVRKTTNSNMSLVEFAAFFDKKTYFRHFLNHYVSTKKPVGLKLLAMPRKNLLTRLKPP